MGDKAKLKHQSSSLQEDRLTEEPTKLKGSKRDAGIVFSGRTKTIQGLVRLSVEVFTRTDDPRVSKRMTSLDEVSFILKGKDSQVYPKIQKNVNRGRRVDDKRMMPKKKKTRKNTRSTHKSRQKRNRRPHLNPSSACLLQRDQDVDFTTLFHILCIACFHPRILITCILISVIHLQSFVL